MNRSQKIPFAIVVASLTVSFGLASAFAATPANPAGGSNFEQRLAQRKLEQNVVLTDNDKTRIVSTCVDAQSKIRLEETNVVPKLAAFTKSYQRIDARLWAVTGQLKLANQDTFKLEKDRLALADKASSFQTTSTNYQQVLDDTTVVNCKADPVGFQALLLTARAYLSQLRTQSADIRSYVVDTVKPQLASHMSDLQPKTPGGGN